MDGSWKAAPSAAGCAVAGATGEGVAGTAGAAAEEGAGAEGAAGVDTWALEGVDGACEGAAVDGAGLGYKARWSAQALQIWEPHRVPWRPCRL